MQRSDRVQAYNNHNWSVNRWLAVRFELTSVLLVACVAIFGLLFGEHVISVGLTGFLLSATMRAYQEGASRSPIFWRC